MTQAPLVPLRIVYRQRVPIAELARNVHSNIAWTVDRFTPLRTEVEDELVIVGGGPSMKSQLGEIASLANVGARVLAVNEVPQHLDAAGIRPWAAARIGPVELTTKCIGDPIRGVRYYAASICPPSAFVALRGADVVMWHTESGNPAVDRIMQDDAPPVLGGGQTIGLRAIALGWALGFRKLHLFGVDSSGDGSSLHSYSSVSDGHKDQWISIYCDGHRFETTPEMAGQAQEFVGVYLDVLARGGTIRVHGDGLLPLIWSHLERGRTAPERFTEKTSASGVVEALRF